MMLFVITYKISCSKKERKKSIDIFPFLKEEKKKVVESESDFAQQSVEKGKRVH